MSEENELEMRARYRVKRLREEYPDIPIAYDGYADFSYNAIVHVKFDDLLWFDSTFFWVMRKRGLEIASIEPIHMDGGDMVALRFSCSIGPIKDDDLSDANGVITMMSAEKIRAYVGMIE